MEHGETKKLKGVTEVINDCNSMGDIMRDLYHETKDLKVSQGAINAYKTAISASKAQLIYKKLSGLPKSIAFLEN